MDKPTVGHVYRGKNPNAPLRLVVSAYDIHAGFEVAYQQQRKDGEYGPARLCWCTTWQDWVKGPVT